LKLPDSIEGCHELIKQLLVLVDGLQREVQELKDRLNKNSRNSHKPPSTDGLRKPALPTKPGGKRGGRPGHKGKTLKMADHVDQTVEIKPEVCSACQEVLDSEGESMLMARRQVFELPPTRLHVWEYQRYSCICGRCGHLNQTDFPAEVSAPVQYGPRVKALVTLLHQSGCLSVPKIQSLFEDLFSAPLNEATIQECQRTAYQRLEEEEEHIQQQLQQSKRIHADESGIRCAGELLWLHELGNERFTYQFVHQRRGMEAHQDTQSILLDFPGWVVHDCWAAYFNLEQGQHALCNAHLLRELNALKEQKREWAADFHAFLLDLYEKTDQGRGQLPQSQHARILRKYNRLLKAGYAEEPPPQKSARGRPKKSKGLNLLERLDMHWHAVLAFCWHKTIPFTNNLAERDIRPAKSKLKVAGCFRTLAGAQAYARIHSFISTVRKHQYNAFNELVNIFSGLTPCYRTGGT
jgi:transposase